MADEGKGDKFNATAEGPGSRVVAGPYPTAIIGASGEDLDNILQSRKDLSKSHERQDIYNIKAVNGGEAYGGFNPTIIKKGDCQDNPDTETSNERIDPNRTDVDPIPPPQDEERRSTFDTNTETIADVFISYHVGTMEEHARTLHAKLRERGIRAFICQDMAPGVDFRRIITNNAVKCKIFMPFINENWAKSKECIYEYNSALTSHNATNKPEIVPIIIGGFGWIRVEEYPDAYSIKSNTNCAVLRDNNWDNLYEVIIKKVGAHQDLSRPQGDGQHNNTTNERRDSDRTDVDVIPPHQEEEQPSTSDTSIETSRTDVDVIPPIQEEEQPSTSYTNIETSRTDVDVIPPIQEEEQPSTSYTNIETSQKRLVWYASAGAVAVGIIAIFVIKRYS